MPVMILMRLRVVGVGRAAAVMACVVHGRFPYVEAPGASTALMLDNIYPRGV